MLKIVLAFMVSLVQYPSELDGLDDWIVKKNIEYKSDFVLPVLKFKVSSLVHEQRYLQ